MPGIPKPTKVVKGNVTTITEYKEENGKLFKLTKTIEKKAVKTTRVIQERRKWKKFGDCKGMGPGVDSSTTTFAEVVYLKLSSNAKDLDEPEEPQIISTNAGSSKIACRSCSGDHWTNLCPFKDTHQPLSEVAQQKVTAGTDKPGKYIPPAKRAGAQVTQSAGAKRDDSLSVRISNLSPAATENDVRDLISRIGSATRVFVAKDYNTGLCKGFAFVTFFDTRSCENCIKMLDGYGYDNLILKVEFAQKSKP